NPTTIAAEINAISTHCSFGGLACKPCTSSRRPAVAQHYPSRDDFRRAADDFIHAVDWKYDSFFDDPGGRGLILPRQTHYDGACARFRWEPGELSRCPCRPRISPTRS